METDGRGSTKPPSSSVQGCFAREFNRRARNVPLSDTLSSVCLPACKGMETMPVTRAEIINAKPREKPYWLFDGGGLYLEIAPSGGRWWRFK